MPYKRLSRAESREQTRLRLLAAAAAGIAKKGLAATSVEDIAAKAGFTRGAFYSNFSGKSELFVELLRADHKHTQENLRKLLDAAASSEDHLPQLVSLYAQCYRDNSNYMLWAEARLHAMRDSKFRQRVNIFYLEKREMIARFTELICTRLDIQLPRSFPDHAFALIALMDGIPGSRGLAWLRCGSEASGSALFPVQTSRLHLATGEIAA